MSEVPGQSNDELMKRYFGTTMEDFKNRKIYYELNPEIVKAIADDDLTQAIHDFIGLKLNGDWDRDKEVVPQLGPGFSAVYFLGELDREVNNGGFNQYFYNCGRESVVRAREAADFMGLKALSAIIADALRI